jgi:hypothetical protein
MVFIHAATSQSLPRTYLGEIDLHDKNAGG